MAGVLVLNADNTALHTVTVKHAIGMLVRQVAIVEEARVGEQIGIFPVPTTLRLVRYVKTGFLYNRTPGWTKRGVMRRDQWRCAYCLGHADTVDHIFPVSRGGENSWLNTVASCSKCNSRKADRTPDEANMPLRRNPYAPSQYQLLTFAA